MIAAHNKSVAINEKEIQKCNQAIQAWEDEEDELDTGRRRHKHLYKQKKDLESRLRLEIERYTDSPNSAQETALTKLLAKQIAVINQDLDNHRESSSEISKKKRINAKNLAYFKSKRDSLEKTFHEKAPSWKAHYAKYLQKFNSCKNERFDC